MDSRKLLCLAIISLLFHFGSSFLLAKEASLCNGFPIYPTTEIKELKEKNPNKINLNFISDELKKSMYRHDHAVFELVKIEIDKAINYLQENANTLGWIEMDKGIYSDGGSDYLTFAKKQADHIALVGVSIWYPMIIQGNLPKKWGTITYNFTEFPIPLIYKGFPLFPSATSLSECKISYDFYGNEVLDINQGDYFGLEPLGILYEYQSIFPRLYGWEQDETISSQKDYSKGRHNFFIKDGTVVKVTGNYNNKSVTFVFFTSEQSKEIILNKTQKSPSKQELLMEKLRQMPKIEKRPQKGEFDNLTELFNRGIITKEEFIIRERELRKQLKESR